MTNGLMDPVKLYKWSLMMVNLAPFCSFPLLEITYFVWMNSNGRVLSSNDEIFDRQEIQKTKYNLFYWAPCTVTMFVAQSLFIYLTTVFVFYVNIFTVIIMKSVLYTS